MKTKILTLVTLAFIGLNTAKAQVGIGTTNPDASAALEVESTTKGFLPPRMTTAQRDAISNPASGLIIFNTSNNCLEFYNNDWVSACDGSIVTSPPPPSTVIGANGVEWMDRNLGASQVATSTNDTQSYGDLYQWGRAADGHEKRNSTTINGNTASNRPGNATDQGVWDGRFILRDGGDNNWLTNTSTNNNLWDGVNGTNNPCPTGFRLPTDAEWDAERLTWAPNNNAVGAFASPLKLPAAGYRQRASGSLENVGFHGSYWSRTVSGVNARNIRFDSTSANMNTIFRANGRSVRCLKD